MISMLIYDRNEKESKILRKCASESVALLSEDKLDITSFLEPEDVEAFLEQKALLDVAFMNVTEKRGIPIAKKTRQNYEMAELFVLADSSVSPMEYLTPGIRASSLLLRPYKVEDAQKVVKEFFHSILRNREENNMEKVLIVENRQGTIPIPYSQIYYLEVREKKVYIRLKTKEYSKYETLESIGKELPENFLRCHRSFIVNTEYIDSIKLSENVINLEDGIAVPLSRSYKKAIKEYMNDLRG